MDWLAVPGVDYLLLGGALKQSVAEFTEFTDDLDGGLADQSGGRAKNPQPRQEGMGLESNVCAGGVHWT